LSLELTSGVVLAEYYWDLFRELFCIMPKCQ
jgi:hypothetical protein